MIKFNNLVNFCNNLYSVGEIITESWRRRSNPTEWKRDVKRSAGAVETEALLQRFNMLPFNEAPEAFREKFPEGYTFISIPENKLPEVKGLQQYGEGYPGLIIGYNTEHNVALVLFDIHVVPGKKYNLYKEKYLAPFSDDEFLNRFNYTVPRLKEVLKPLGFKSEKKRVQFVSSVQLSTGPTNITLHAQSTYQRLNRPIDNITLNFVPNLFERDENSSEYNELPDSVELTTSSPESLRWTIKKHIEYYNERIAAATPISEAMNMIKEAAKYKLVSSEVERVDTNKLLKVTFSTGNVYNSIKSFGFKMEAGILKVREDLPKTLPLPISNQLSLRLAPQKDKSTGKKFLLVRMTQDNNINWNIFSKNSSVYKKISSIIANKDNVPQETSSAAEQYNKLTKDGKEMFAKYLLRNYDF